MFDLSKQCASFVCVSLECISILKHKNACISYSIMLRYVRLSGKHVN